MIKTESNSFGLSLLKSFILIMCQKLERYVYPGADKMKMTVPATVVVVNANVNYTTLPHEIISTVCDFPYKIIEKCFQ